MRREHETLYTVDADQAGNVARYVNHSCQPNLFIQPVLSDSANPFLARLCFFALRNIGAYEELTCVSLTPHMLATHT